MLIKENPPAAGFLLLVDAWMLIHQSGTFFLQFFNLGVNILNLLLYIIVVLTEDLFRFLDIRCRRRFAVSFMVIPVIKPITAITIR